MPVVTACWRSGVYHLLPECHAYIEVRINIRGIIVFVTVKTTKYFLVSVEHSNILFYFIMITCFGHLTIK
jgi:hypothetical protein